MSNNNLMVTLNLYYNIITVYKNSNKKLVVFYIEKNETYFLFLSLFFSKIYEQQIHTCLNLKITKSFHLQQVKIFVMQFSTPDVGKLLMSKLFKFTNCTNNYVIFTQIIFAMNELATINLAGQSTANCTSMMLNLNFNLTTSRKSAIAQTKI